jgi:molecular chaperone DnaK (HSP70)
MNNIIVGLDLGTDKCCITYQDKLGRPFIITDDNNYKISSIIGILKSGETLVGNDISKDNIYDIPIISNLKRLIGLKADDPNAIKIANYHNWELSNSISDQLIINNKYYLNDLLCILLKKIKHIIVSNIGEDFELVITVPANFNEGQKNFILECCNNVGITVKRLLYEPCSAALAYIHYYPIQTDNLNMVVFDFGAGTLDLALVSCNAIVDDDQPESIEWFTKIEKNIGDNNLGGIDIDMVLSAYLIDKYPELSKLNDLRFIVEKIKIKLSSCKYSVLEKYYDIYINITLEEYYDLLNKHFKDRIISLLDQLIDKKINTDKVLLIGSSSNHIKNIDKVLLIGSSSYNPWIIDLVSNYFKIKISDNKINISKYNIDLREIGVSLGASCFSKKKLSNNNNLILTETLPLSIGIETVNDQMCKILLKDSIIPVSSRQYFTTSEDNQTSLEIKLYQGERDSVKDNYYLGSFKLENLEAQPQGKLVIIIVISVTTDGLITVEGKVKNNVKNDKKIIINRYKIDISESNIMKNIKEYEQSDLIFNSIMQKYYQLITFLSRLQYNLIDNVINLEEPKYVKDIFSQFWQDIINIYNLMLSSEKIKPNIDQLTKFILYIETKLKFDTKLTNYDLIDDKLLINKLENLNKYLESNFQHLVLTYQTKIIEEANKTDHDNLLLNEESNIINKESNIINKELDDLCLLIIENIESFEISDNHKLLLLNVIEACQTNKDINLEDIQKCIINIQNLDENKVDQLIILLNEYSIIEFIKLINQ